MAATNTQQAERLIEALAVEHFGALVNAMCALPDTERLAFSVAYTERAEWYALASVGYLHLLLTDPQHTTEYALPAYYTLPALNTEQIECGAMFAILFLAECGAIERLLTEHRYIASNVPVANWVRALEHQAARYWG